MDDILSTAMKSMPDTGNALSNFHEQFVNTKNAVIGVFVISIVLILVKWIISINYAVAYIFDVSFELNLFVILIKLSSIFTIGLYTIKNVVVAYVPNEIYSKDFGEQLQKKYIFANTSIVLIVTSLLSFLDFNNNFARHMFNILVPKIFGGWRGDLLTEDMIKVILIFVIFNVIITGIFSLLVMKKSSKDTVVKSSIKFFLIRLITNVITNILYLIMISVMFYVIFFIYKNIY